MNLVKFNKAQVKLNKKQRQLYKLINEKLRKDEPITIEEAKDLYINHGCRNVRDGTPYYYNYWHRNEKGEIQTVLEPMDEEQIRKATTLYLMGGIGALVMKGALKIVPQLELK